jgi:hypothetical protein
MERYARRSSLDEQPMHIAPWNEVARGAPTNPAPVQPSRHIIVDLNNSNATIGASTVSWQLSSPSIGRLAPGTRVHLLKVVATNQGTVPLEWAVSGFNALRVTSGSDGYALRGYMLYEGGPLYAAHIGATLLDLDVFSSGRRVTLHLLTPGGPAFTTSDTYRLTLSFSEP